MKDLNKLYDFAVFCVSVLAAVGGTAYLFYDNHPLFGVANLALVAMAVPYVVKRVKDIMQ